MSEVTHYSKRGSVAVIGIDSPPVNGFGHLVRAAVVEHIDEALADDGVEAIVVHGAGRMFSAGADIREFGTELALRRPMLMDVISAAEEASKPVIVAIHGVAAGGGCEFALGCHYRIAATDSRIGLPEVNLGIIPGAGGTQRMPRVVGVPAALDFIIGGKLNPATKAYDVGLVDELFEGDPADAGVAYAEKLIADGKGPRRTGEMNERVEAARGKAEVFERARGAAEELARGVAAPLAAIESIENATRMPFEEGLETEREIFIRCMESDQSKALRYAFFAEREVAKILDVPKDTPKHEIRKAAVIGCGNKGLGICMAFANAEIPVKVLDLSQSILDEGLERVEEAYDSGVAKGRISAEERHHLVSTIAGTLDYTDLADADVVVEAVVEDLDAKKQVFAGLDRACKAGAILASCTATLDVDEIAAVTARPADVAGFHFFSPADVTRVLEIVRGKETADAVLVTAMALAKRLNKTGIVVGPGDGLVGNRMLFAYMDEAHRLVAEGCAPQEIDAAMYDFGFPVGPFAMAEKHPEIETMIFGTEGAEGIEPREFGAPEIVERCVQRLATEGARLLEEGIAQRPSDIDVVWMHGFGFPRHHGGPMFWADSRG
jgi:3-hydroxyacyl-CoA dehydrogenase